MVDPNGVNPHDSVTTLSPFWDSPCPLPHPHPFPLPVSGENARQRRYRSGAYVAILVGERRETRGSKTGSGSRSGICEVTIKMNILDILYTIGSVEPLGVGIGVGAPAV